ncbi:MAG: hypothetical protein V1752_02250 [Candidatus Firestonebacteria bacterium]
MRKLFKGLLVFGMLMLVFEGTCYAHSLSPLLIPFFPFIIPGILAKLFGISLEAFLLKIKFQDITFTAHLLRSFYFNVVSTVLGFLAFFIIPEWTIMWFNPLDAATIFPPLLIFFIVIAVEIPLVKWFYRHSELTWPRATIVSFVINLFSYFISLLLLFICFPVYWGIGRL